MDPSLLKLMTDFGPTGVIVGVSIYLVRSFTKTFQDLRAEEAKRTDAFMALLQEQLKVVTNVTTAGQATALVLQGVIAEARELVDELRTMRAAKVD